MYAMKGVTNRMENILIKKILNVWKSYLIIIAIMKGLSNLRRSSSAEIIENITKTLFVLFCFVVEKNTFKKRFDGSILLLAKCFFPAHAAHQIHLTLCYTFQDV